MSNNEEDSGAQTIAQYRETADKLEKHPNMVWCAHCLAVVESVYRNDFRGCDCVDHETRVFVDGGLDYPRRPFGPRAAWVEVAGWTWRPSEEEGT